jgi:dihydroxyacid dehydratase/phosphogluconate dehydratase
MDANTHLTARLPGRHATEGPARASHRAVYGTMGPTVEQMHRPLVGVAEIHKRTPYIANLKPSGRHVAKDMLEAGGVIALHGNLASEGAGVKVAGMGRLQFSGPARCFDGEEVCVETVKNKKYREGDVLVIRYEGPKGGCCGAVTHADAAAGKACYAEI